MTRSEALKELIRLGERSRTYWDSELPKRHLNAAEPQT